MTIFSHQFRNLCKTLRAWHVDADSTLVPNKKEEASVDHHATLGVLQRFLKRAKQSIR